MRILSVLTLAAGIATPAAMADGAGPSPQIGNFTQSLVWGKIDENVPPVLGNGDIGGLFDPFNGTTCDELRFGSGANRDIRTLFLTQVMVPDYWVLEDQALHFLDPRHYRPRVPRRYLTLGAPFTWSLRPADTEFPEKLADHQQTLDISTGRLTSRYRIGTATYTIETIIFPDQSVIAYQVTAGAPMRFEIAAIASPEVAPRGNAANPRYEQTRNGYTADESEPDVIVLKQVSNVFLSGLRGRERARCPAQRQRVRASGRQARDLCGHWTSVAGPAPSAGRRSGPPGGPLRVCEPVNGA